MRYQTAAAFRQALEARLRLEAREQSAPLPLMRKMVVFERLVARLVQISPDAWIIKGGAALVFRAGFDARATRDLDLGRVGTVEAATRDMEMLGSLDLDDHFEYSLMDNPGALPIHDARVVRYGVNADLAGRRFERVSVDVGFDIDGEMRPDRIVVDSVLGFANLQPVVIPAITLEDHLAQKLHAYVQIFPDSRVNTRARDLVDIILIGGMGHFVAGRIREAISRTFDTRAAQTVPTALPAPPTGWRRMYPPLAREVGLEPDLAIGHARAASFVDPVLQGAVDDRAIWDSSVWAWRVSDAD